MTTDVRKVRLALDLVYETGDNAWAAYLVIRQRHQQGGTE